MIDAHQSAEKAKTTKAPSLLLLAMIGIVIGALGVWLGLLQSQISTMNNRGPASIYKPAIDDYTFDDVIYIPVGATIQNIVNAHPPGSVFLIGEGVHRLQTITPRDGDIFIGEGNTTLSGAILLTDFAAEDEVWKVEHPELSRLEPREGGFCQAAYPRCNHAYDIYVDDEPLHHVDNPDAVETGTWYFNYDEDYLLLGTDPDGHRVELSVNIHAFKGEAVDVSIHNFTIEKHAGWGQIGAVRAQDTDNWIFSNNVVQLNSGAGITFGNGMHIIDNRIVRNGQIGLSGQGDNVVVYGNEIAYNNYANYDPGWEAGGTKFVATDNLLVSKNYVHHNQGPGLWTDIDNINTLYEDNIVTYNSRSGIMHEISYDATIRNNIVKYNVNARTSVYVAAQILISASSNVDVYDNEVVMSERGGNGIVIVQQDRGAGDLGAYEARGNHVHNNIIIHLSDAGETGGATDAQFEDWFWTENHYDNNNYYAPFKSLSLWGWVRPGLQWNDLEEVGIESNGAFSTDIPLRYLSVVPWQSILDS